MFTSLYSSGKYFQVKFLSEYKMNPTNNDKLNYGYFSQKCFHLNNNIYEKKKG